MTDSKIDRQLCLCPPCPSYADCGELAFCLPAGKKSKCIQKEKGCLCPSCPVQEEMQYNHVYYCTRGNDKEQSVRRQAT